MLDLAGVRESLIHDLSMDSHTGFPPPALPGFNGITSPSVTPQRPDFPSRASGWSSPTTPRGFPCCVCRPCVHAVATTPAQRRAVLPCSIRSVVSAFPDRVAGSACASSFSRFAQRSLALRPAHSRCHRILWHAYSRRLQRLRYLHHCSSSFRREHFAGWAFHPLEQHRLFTAHTLSSRSSIQRAGSWLRLHFTSSKRKECSEAQHCDTGHAGHYASACSAGCA